MMGPCYPGHIGTAKVGGPVSLCGKDGPNILQAEYTKVQKKQECLPPVYVVPMTPISYRLNPSHQGHTGTAEVGGVTSLCSPADSVKAR